MKILVAAALASFMLTAPASAALVADFQLNGSLADALGGPDITNNGGTLGANGISFGLNQGPSLGGFANTSVYSVVMRFSFASLTGYRKILDFKNQGSDNGLYNLDNSLNFFPFAATVSNQFQEDTFHIVVFTRDADDTVVAYVDANPGLTFIDSAGDAIITDTLNFFIDDFIVPDEASSGFVDWIRIYDTALPPAQVADIPEPASWAMMIAGFGLVGAAMRRRAATLATA
jgi:hypothetical protein